MPAYDFDDLAPVDIGHAGGAVSVFSRNSRFDTADRAVIKGVFFRNAEIDKTLDGSTVIEKRWHAASGRDQAGGGFEQFFRRLLADAHRKIRFGHGAQVHGFDA